MRIIHQPSFQMLLKYQLKSKFINQFCGSLLSYLSSTFKLTNDNPAGAKPLSWNRIVENKIYLCSKMIVSCPFSIWKEEHVPQDYSNILVWLSWSFQEDLQKSITSSNLFEWLECIHEHCQMQIRFALRDRLCSVLATRQANGNPKGLGEVVIQCH